MSCCEFDIGDIVRIGRNGSDVHTVCGHAKTQPKAIIDVDGEPVYVPYSCLVLVKKANAAKLEYVIRELNDILEDRGSVVSICGRLSNVLRRLDNT